MTPDLGTSMSRTGLPWWQLKKKRNLPEMQDTQEFQVQSLGREDPLEEGMTNPLQYSCLENPMDRGAWQAIVPGFTESQIGLN